jgi:hypothetical protein
VEVRDQSETLPDFIHPERAVYIFGPEDGHVPRGVLTVSHRFLRIPTVTRTPLNLAAAVNVVLYDRLAKAQGAETRYTTGGGGTMSEVTTNGFDWRSHVRTLAEAGGLYPADIAYDVIDKMVSLGEVSITDESTKEIVYTEAENYAAGYFRENGYEF